MSQTSSSAAAIVGTWRLVAHVQELLDTGEKVNARGKNPRGFLTYTPDGRFHVLNMPGAADRPRPKGVSPTDQEALGLFKGLTAYCGRYSVNGDKMTHHVDIAWNESWGGTDQERGFKLDGDRLTITSGPLLSPWDGRRVFATMTYERVR